uniref:Coiled-coil domain-containing protein 51 n=1 Tax=Aceria tosichella TaxID=561515 RepID=A0A6G1SAG4_9ACAR
MIPTGLTRCYLVVGRRHTALTSIVLPPITTRPELILAPFQLDLCRTRQSSHSSTSQTSANNGNDKLGGDGGTSSSSSIKSLRLSPNIVDSFHQNVNWFNQQYERVFGIAEIREMQARVLDAESEFVEVTQKRKVCQDKIEHFKDEIKKIRDKLEMTPRQSDNYLKLITQEHNLLREQLALDVQLTQFKEREQFLLDNLSKLLRQSHELERLRQERAKYWQIISIALSLAGSLVAIIAQRVRNQKSVITHLVAFDERLLTLEESMNKLQTVVDRQHEVSLNTLNKINASLDELAIGLANRRADNSSSEKKQPQTGSWWPRIPGLSTLKSLFRYNLS